MIHGILDQRANRIKDEPMARMGMTISCIQGLVLLQFAIQTFMAAF
jgi:hypothetical protein